MQIYFLIIWNNQFGVDFPLTEKPGGGFAQARTENCPRVKVYLQMQVPFLKFFSSSDVFLAFLLQQINYLVSLSVD